MKKNTLSDDSKIAALHENFSHLRHVMGARLWFTSIHAAVIALLFKYFSEGDLTIIIFGYLITVVGIIYVIRESNAVDNYMEKISRLAEDLKLRKANKSERSESEQDYLAIHLDWELPSSFVWKYVFRVRTAFVLYYSSMMAIVTEFLLRKFSICNCWHILVDIAVFVILFCLLYYTSETFRRSRRNLEEKEA